MKKASLLAVLGLALITVMCTSTISPVKARIESWDWFGQFHDYDPYFDMDDVTVFPEGTTATLRVEVYNQYGVELNVSAVKVLLDWNVNYSSTECSEDTPLVMQPDTYHTFTVTFPVPSTSIASNLFIHGYTIYVEEVNATTGPKRISLHDIESGNDFIVYSSVQKDAQRLYDELNVLMGIVDPDDFESIEAAVLWGNGTLEYQFGLSSHISGDFINAKAHYETARELFYEALSTETSFWKYWEDYDRREAELDLLMQQAYIAQLQANATYREAQATYYEALANATMKQAEAAVIEANATMKQADAEFADAEAAKTQAIAWIVFGIGFVVFGFATVVWAYRRPIPTEKK